ncbi:hypothetical protein PNA2_1040 [Pyrococcus sp. NA2]|uniref:hypothetical protein n=1 Tax=Pyrococcus sp. (strain NA2) TaxID=342949 RepID=UPI000209AA0F|nr:hypothetical protein [Pyrococcus sp. NA2]AEC51956.1 hypothetical protein PNA2_1040 [Pyrococcus sp. NA2]
MLVIETTNVIWKYMKKYKQMVKLVKEEVIILEPGRNICKKLWKLLPFMIACFWHRPEIY